MKKIFAFLAFSQDGFYVIFFLKKTKKFILGDDA